MRVIGLQVLTSQEWQNHLAQISVCSRPVAPTSDDPDDFEYLTPNRRLGDADTWPPAREYGCITQGPIRSSEQSADGILEGVAEGHNCVDAGEGQME